MNQLMTIEQKARTLDAVQHAELCVLENRGRNENPFRKTGDIDLEQEWDRAWSLHSELRGLRSMVACLEEVLRRNELRARGCKRSPDPGMIGS